MPKGAYFVQIVEKFPLFLVIFPCFKGMSYCAMNFTISKRFLLILTL